jgi:dolichyl-phosphate-mannose--protein O-mannosyl transferase
MVRAIVSISFLCFFFLLFIPSCIYFLILSLRLLQLVADSYNKSES